MPQNIFKIFDGRNYFWQWDTNQKLIVLDETVDKVHFSNRDMTHAISKDVFTDKDGKRVCYIPDTLLTLPRNLIAAAIVTDDNANKTLKQVKFAVQKRAIPSDYVVSDDVQSEDITDRLNIVEELVEDMRLNLPNSYDAKGSAAQALADAKLYMAENYDKIGSAESVMNNLTEEIARAENEEAAITRALHQMNDRVTDVEESIDTKIAEVVTGYATEEYVENKIAEAKLSNNDINLSGYATKNEIPKKTSQLINDSGFLTEHQDLTDYAKIADLGDLAKKDDLTASDVGADVSGTARSLVSEHNSDEAAHADIRELVSELYGQNPAQGGMSAELTAALADYFSHVMPQFDDANGLVYVNAVLTALGAEPRGEGGDSGGEEVPDEPDQPGGEGGGTTGDALPTDGLMAYFDLRNLGDKANVTVGTAKGVVATQGSGALYSWAASPITGSDEYGMKSDRGMFFSSTGGSNQTDLGTEFTVISFGYGECIGPGIEATNITPRWMLKPKYNNAGGTAYAPVIQAADLNGDDMTDYNFAVYRVSSSALTIINDTSRKDYNGSDYEGFVSWDSLPTVGRTFYGTGYGTAVAIYNRAISDVEIEEARAFMKTLEVTA